MIRADELVAGMLAMRGKRFGLSRCLRAVYIAAGRPPVSGSWSDAKEAYERTVAAAGPLRTDWENAPPGAVHYTAGDPGHIWVSLGGGRGITTNAWQRQDGFGVGDVFDDGRERLLARIDVRDHEDIVRGRGRYLGWAMQVFGHDIITATAPAGGGTTPLKGHPLMALTDKEQAELLRTMRAVYKLITALGGAVAWIKTRIAGSLSGPSVTQMLRGIGASTGPATAAEVDVDELAAALLDELGEDGVQLVLTAMSKRLAADPAEPGALE